jgi:hypothetical protein
MFEHTKVGDVVLVIREIRIRNYSGVHFAVKEEVGHTTKTQIVVNGIRYYRKNGKAVGDWNQGIYHIGDDMAGRWLASPPEEVDKAEFKRLENYSRRFRELIDVFLPNLKSPEMAAIFRQKTLRDQLARDANALYASLTEGIKDAGLGSILEPKK